MRRFGSLGFAATLAAFAPFAVAAASAQTPGTLRDVLGDDPLARQIEQAPVTSVTWVAGPDGRKVPLVLGSSGAPQPLGGAEATAGQAQPGSTALGGLPAHPELLKAHGGRSGRSNRRAKAPRQALKQARHIETHRSW